jgi:hypothetical protein
MVSVRGGTDVILGAISLLAFSMGCGGEQLDPLGAHYQMHLVGVQDGCHSAENWQTFEEKDFVYSVTFPGGSEAVISLGGHSFARSSTLAGCSIDSYYSPVFKEEAPGNDEEHWVQWELEGTASFQQGGGSSCGIEAEANELMLDYGFTEWGETNVDVEPKNLDWIGIEIFRIVGVGESVTDLEIGCEYHVMTTGVELSEE